MKGAFGSWLLGLTLALLPGMAQGAETTVWEFGLRGGMEAAGSTEQYRVGEAYLLRDLPWRNGLAGGVLMVRLDLGAGYLWSDNDRGSWLAGGGDLVWQIVDGLVEVEAGFRPTWLTDHRYGEDDFGGGLQFSSHAGIALRLQPLVINYRYQHTSNAGLYHDNDGLDLHLFGVAAKF